jgi:type II secretory pathway pseudopilin PulG
MIGILFRLFGIGAIVILIVFMAASAFRRARRLDARIRAFRDEQDELTRSGRTQDPYAALADIYSEEEKHGRNTTHQSRPKRR